MVHRACDVKISSSAFCILQ